MSTTTLSFSDMSNTDLVHELKRLAAVERQATARLVACLMELDARRLYLGEGCSSLFTYCTQVLHLSEHAAYGRIEAARTARKFPIVLELFASGTLTLTNIGLLAPHLTTDNHRKLLDAAKHKSKREVEQLVAALRPQPDVRSTVRKLPAPRPLAAPSMGVDTDVTPTLPAVAVAPRETTRVAIGPAVVVALAPERFKVQFTVSRATHDKLRRTQDLLRHQIPTGDPALVFDRALTLLLGHLERAKLAAAARPRGNARVSSNGRYIPAAVKRAVWRRDGGRCAFIGSEGRCAETGRLEFHHVTPYAAGGKTTTDNLQLRCRAHNEFENECAFGPRGTLFVREHCEMFGSRTTRSGPSHTR